MSSTTSTPKTNKMAVDKKTTKKTSEPVVAAPAPAPTPAAPVKKEKAPKAAPAPKASAPEIVVPTTTDAAAVILSSDAQLTKLTETLKALSSEFSSKVRDAVRATQEAAKQAKKEARDSKKKKRKAVEDMTPEEKKSYEARRANNAFLVQRPLTDELCAFMGLKAGDKRSQTEVTKFISEYVKSHSCYDPKFKRRILPNAALAKILRVDDKTEVTYLNLQRFLKVHFVKAPVA